MPDGLKRFQHECEDHFVTFSCHRRRPYLATPEARDVFLESLEAMRQRYEFEVLGYVVMPEHVHLLLSEPPDHEHHALATALQAVKISSARRLRERPFWQRRYYDFNVFSHDKRVEKLRYMHRNPAKRELVERPEAWGWSSFRFYLEGRIGPVKITSI
jgi:putative transposase